MLLVRKDVGKMWNFPEKTGTITLEEAIGDLPSLNSEIYDVPYDKLIEVFPDFKKRKKRVKRFPIGIIHQGTY